jgi:hypothetical protein
MYRRPLGFLRDRMTEQVNTIFDGPIECSVEAMDACGDLSLIAPDGSGILVSADLLQGVALNPGEIVTLRLMRGSVNPEGK